MCINEKPRGVVRSRGDCVKPFVTLSVSAKPPRASNKDEDNDGEDNDGAD